MVSYKAYLVNRIIEKSPNELEERVLYQLSNPTLEKILKDFENGKFYKTIEHDYQCKDVYFGKKNYYERKYE